MLCVCNLFIRRHQQSSLAALQSSIERHDWESATRHCARAMSLPLDVVSGPFAETAVVRLIFISSQQVLTGLVITSPLQKFLFLLCRRCKPPVSSSWPYFNVNSRKRRRLATRQQPVASLNCSRPLVGKLRVFKRMPPS